MTILLDALDLLGPLAFAVTVVALGAALAYLLAQVAGMFGK